MATITNVQAAKYGTGTTSATVSWDSTPTAGNLLIARSYVLGGTSSGSITGWTQVVNVLYGVGNRYVAVYFKIAGASEGSVTCSATTAATTSLVIEEWSSSTGWDSSPFDKSASTATTGIAVTSRSTGTTATTTVADELAISVIGYGSTVTGISWSNSFTASFEQPTGALVFAGAHKVLSATGAVESTASWTTARVAGAAVATFKSNSVITGTLSSTQASDTVSSAGALALKGTTTQTQAGNTLTASAVITLSGYAAISESGNTLSAAGVLPISGAVSQTQTDNTLSASGAVSIAGVFSVTQDAQTVSSAGASSAAITGYGNVTIIRAARLTTIYPSAIETIKAQRNTTIKAQPLQTIKAPALKSIKR